MTIFESDPTKRASRLKQALPRSVSTFLRNHGVRSLSTLKYAVFYDRYLRRTPPTYVYQMGKVGSMSLYRSLIHHYDGLVIQGHNLSETNPDRMVRRLREHILVRQAPVNLITMTREPIGWALSSFFQNFERFVGESASSRDYSTDELRDLFLKFHDHQYALDWFDINYRELLGINVYSQPFPKAEGFQLLERDNVKVLIMHCEMPNAKKQQVVADFLGLQTFEIRNENQGEAKDYAELYRKFKTEVKLPAEYFSKMCDSEYFNHFYDRSVLESVRARWCIPSDSTLEVGRPT